MLVDRLDSDVEERLERGLGADPGEPGRRRVERARVGGEVHRRPVVARVRVVAGVPARVRRPYPRPQLRPDVHERRAARRAEPLVAVRRDASARLASNGSQPQPWMASITTSASCARAASITASRSSTSPEDDWTRLAATTSVRSSISSARRSSGTTRVSTPRSACAMNGNMSEAKSPSGTRTRAPSGTVAATSPMSAETAGPVDDVLGGHVDHAGAERPRAVGRLVPVLVARAAVVPVLERRLDSVPGRLRRQAVRRRVEVRPRRAPELLGLGELH